MRTLSDLLKETETAEAAAMPEDVQPISMLLAEQAQPAAPMAPPVEVEAVQGTLPGTVSAVEAAGRGALSGATLGFEEEAGAGIQAGLEALRRRVETSPTGRAALEAAGIGVTPTQTTAMGQIVGSDNAPLTEVYRQAREELRATTERAQRSAPGAFLAGQVAGGVAQAAAAPVTGMGRLAALGGLQALGLSEADVTKGEVGKAALDVATGAGLSVAGGKAAQALPAVVRKQAEKIGLDDVLKSAEKKTSDALAKFAAMRFVKATGAIQKDINKETEKQILKKGFILGREGMIPWSGNKEVIAKNVEAAKQQAGSAMEDILGAADAEMFVNRVDVNARGPKEFDWGRVLMRINKEIRSKLSVTGLRVSGASLKAPVGEYAPSFYDDIAQTAAKGGGFLDANRLKTDIAEGPYSTLSTKLQTRVAKQVAGILNDEIEQQLAKAVGNKAASQFAKAKNIYGATKLAEKGLKTAAAQQGNNLFGLSEMLVGPAAGGIAAVTGMGGGGVGAAGAAATAAAVATKLAKERGSAVLGRGAMAVRAKLPEIRPALKSVGVAVEKYLTEKPELFGRFAQPLMEAANQGAKNLAVADYTLANQSAEYRTLREKLDKLVEEEKAMVGE
jgi:hypothetical protein